MSKLSAVNQGVLSSDNNRDSVQVGSGFVTSDATGTPITSPVSLTTTAVKTIVVPDNAVLMTVWCATTIRVSEIVAMTYYDLVQGYSKEVFQVSKMQNIYICNDSSTTANLFFKFIVL